MMENLILLGGVTNVFRSVFIVLLFHYNICLKLYERFGEFIIIINGHIFILKEIFYPISAAEIRTCRNNRSLPVRTDKLNEMPSINLDRNKELYIFNIL